MKTLLDFGTANTGWLVIIISLNIALFVAVVKNYNLARRDFFIENIGEKIRYNLFFVDIEEIPIKYLDNIFINTLSDYFNINIFDTNKLNYFLNYIKDGDIDDQKKKIITMSLRKAIINKPIEILGEFYALSSIKKDCFNEPFVDVREYISDILWHDKMNIQDREQYYLSVIKYFNDFIQESNNEEHKNLITTLKLNAEKNLSQYC